MALGNIYRAAVRGHLDTVEWVNTLYFKQLSAGGDLSGLAASIDSIIYQGVESIEAPGWGLDDITISELVVGGGEQLVEPSTTVGTVTGAPRGATTVSVVISFRSTLAGRSHRGRNYLALYNTGSELQGSLLAASKTTVEAAYDAFLTAYGDAGTDTDYTWGVWSRKLGETLDTSGRVTAYNPAAGFFPVHAIRVDSVLRTQRRRELGVGS